MFMAVRKRQGISARHLFAALIAAGVILLAAHGARAQVTCEDCDQCMKDCVCQSDGTCEGTPKSNTADCDDGNPCTMGDHCDGAGSCVGASNAPSNTDCNDHNDCTINDHCDGAGTCVGTDKAGGSCSIAGLGPCATGTCIEKFGFVYCNATPKDCGDKCHFCNPSTGDCEANTFCSLDPCSTGECDPDTGECIPGHEGETCDDGNVCTTTSQCQNGECVGTSGGTPGPTSTPTPTPQSVSGCVGDCDDNGVVTVDEIITGINIALGNADVPTCDKFDANGDGLVTVDEILTAVNNALSGCPRPESTPTPSPAPPTSTPTQTPTPPTVTPSPTTSAAAGTLSIGTRAAGTVESTTSAFLVIPDLLSALLGHLPSFLPSASGTGALSLFPVSFKCPTGGGQVDCSQQLFPTFTISLNNCQLTSSTGATLIFNGSLTATGQQGDSCLSVPTHMNIATQTLSIETQTATGSTTATFTSFSADVTLACNHAPCDCRYDTVVLHPTGSINVVTKDASNTTLTSTEIDFSSGSSITITVASYGTQCVPKVYDMVVKGNITLTTDSNPPFAATYDAYTIHDDASSAHDMVKVSGAVTSDCFGDTVTFSTPTDIALGTPCPSAGVVDATASSNTYVITYSGSGVDVDSAHFDSCLSTDLFVCPVS